MKRLKATAGRLLGGRELLSGPCRTLTHWSVEMTKASLETPSDPLRVLNNKDIHEMIGTFPTLLPKLAEKLVRRTDFCRNFGQIECQIIAGSQ